MLEIGWNSVPQTAGWSTSITSSKLLSPNVYTEKNTIFFKTVKT